MSESGKLGRVGQLLTEPQRAAAEILLSSSGLDSPAFRSLCRAIEDLAMLNVYRHVRDQGAMNTHWYALSVAAKALGISAQMAYRRLKALGMGPKSPPEA